MNPITDDAISPSPPPSLPRSFAPSPSLAPSRSLSLSLSLARSLALSPSRPLSLTAGSVCRWGQTMNPITDDAIYIRAEKKVLSQSLNSEP